jgi:hypothetical protein
MTENFEILLGDVIDTDIDWWIESQADPEQIELFPEEE